jgi:DNA-binding CsgD family transcriptional regulator
MTQEPRGELSAREIEILAQVATGATNQQIALALHISANTVKAHLRNIFAKLGVESRTEATLVAIQQGLVAVDVLVDETAPQAADEPPSVPDLVAPAIEHTSWPMARGQRWALLVALLLVVATAVLPDARAVAPVAGARLIDQPSPVSALAEAGPSSRWSNKAQMPTPRGRFAQAEVDGMIYVVAGLTDEGWTARVEAYDPAQDLWDRRALKPTAVANIGAAVVDGLIYVPGGLGEDNVVSDVLEVYDPVTDTWAARRALPRPLCAYSIAPFGQGFYLFGGWDGKQYLDRTYYYDVVADAWREEQPLTGARAFAAAVAVNDRIYLVGGHDGQDELRRCESYAPALGDGGKGAWQAHAPLKYGRAGHGMALVQGVLYVVGGGWDRPLVYNERYDVANDAWATFDSPIVGEWRSLGVSSISSGAGVFVYAVGGWSGRYLSAVKAYQALFRIYLP